MGIEDLLSLLGGGVGVLLEPIEPDDWAGIGKLKIKTNSEDDTIPLLHSKDGKLWLDWIDSFYEVGWTKKLDENIRLLKLFNEGLR